MLLGPRVLRTETAALTAITALQCRFWRSGLTADPTPGPPFEGGSNRHLPL